MPSRTHALVLQLADDKHQRLRALAQNRSPDPFIERALLALADAQAGGPVYDGPAYVRYLRDRVRCAVTGSEPRVPKPEPITWAAVSASGHKG